MKKVLIVIFLLFILTGCENKEEKEKSEYLTMKSELLANSKFTELVDLDCNVIVNIDRVSDEKYSYEMIISNPKVNMRNIKAILVHNYYTEDVFPTVGLFNDSKELLVNSEDNIILKGDIETDKDIDNLNLQLKLLLRYTDENGNKKDIYYKTTK